MAVKIAMILSLLVVSLTLKGETIELRADEWCPFTCAPGSSEPGLLIEIADKIFSAKGIEINYELLNWARALELARSGVIHGVAGASHGDAPELLFPSKPQAVVFNEYYKNAKSDFQFKGPESLKNRKIAVIKAYFYDDSNTDLQKTMKSSFVYLTGSNVQEQMIKMLQTGRIDAAIESTAVFNWNLKRLQIPEGTIVSAGKSDSKPMELYLAFDPKQSRAKEWVKILEEGMIQIRKSGELDKILAKYNFKDHTK